jgi:GWxTD domain-containing protein
METRAAILCAVICAAGLFTAAAQDVPRLDRTGLQPYDLDLWLRCRVEHFGHEEELLLRTNSADAHLVYRLFDADKGRRFLGERSRTLQSWRGDTLWRIPVEAPLERFVLEVSLTDRASGRTVRDVLEIDRRRDDPGWYALADFNGRSVLPANAPVGVPVRPFCRLEGTRHLWVRYFGNLSAAAPPPDARRDDAWAPRMRPDSAWRIENGGALRLLYEGLYWISADSAARDGFPVLSTPADFPDITRADELALSIRYISTNDEYERLNGRMDIKPELDRFWLKAAQGDMEMARENIRLYYGRIRAANGFFGDCKPGWKTDRGIIFTVFGPPDQVEKRPGSEIWYYGPTKLRGQVSFVFEAFFAKQWILRRDPSYRIPYAAEVYEWRNGLSK